MLRSIQFASLSPAYTTGPIRVQAPQPRQAVRFSGFPKEQEFNRVLDYVTGSRLGNFFRHRTFQSLESLVEQGKVDIDVEFAPGSGPTPFSYFAKADNIGAMRRLAALGANVNYGYFYTPFTEAMDEERYDTARILAGLGANVDFTDSDGRTQLMRQALFNNLEAVQLLLELGADVSKKTAPRHAHGPLENKTVLDLVHERNARLVDQGQAPAVSPEIIALLEGSQAQPEA
jgi:ankyrin repeat protein